MSGVSCGAGTAQKRSLAASSLTRLEGWRFHGLLLVTQDSGPARDVQPQALPSAMLPHFADRAPLGIAVASARNSGRSPGRPAVQSPKRWHRRLWRGGRSCEQVPAWLRVLAGQLGLVRSLRPSACRGTSTRPRQRQRHGGQPRSAEIDRRTQRRPCWRRRQRCTALELRRSRRR